MFAECSAQYDNRRLLRHRRRLFDRDPLDRHGCMLSLSLGLLLTAALIGALVLVLEEKR